MSLPLPSLDRLSLSPLLEEKDECVYPNKWMVDLIAPMIMDHYKDKVTLFYRSVKTPTVLVGKQKHPLPFYRCNFSCHYLDNLSKCGRDDPDTLLEGFDIVLDPLFILFWTTLNLDAIFFVRGKVEDFEKCDFDTPLMVLDFLQPSRWEVVKKYLTWYQQMRPVSAPIVRFSYNAESHITWILVDPQKRTDMVIQDNGYSVIDKETGRHFIYHRFRNDNQFDVNTNIAHISTVAESKIEEGWTLFIEMTGGYNGDIIFLVNYLKEIYSTTSQRRVSQIIANNA